MFASAAVFFGKKEIKKVVISEVLLLLFPLHMHIYIYIYVLCIYSWQLLCGFSALSS